MKLKRRPPNPIAPRFEGAIEELERRLLFSADAASLLPGDPAASVLAASTDAPMVQVLPAVPDTQTRADNAAEAQATTQVVGPAAVLPPAKPVEVVFVDAHVQDAQSLMDDIARQQDGSRTLEVHWLDAGTDGIQAITDVLRDRHDVTALHLISHGGEGVLQLGSTILNADTLGAHASELTAWRQAMTADADLLIYGCDVAATPAGRDFLQNLSLLTGADVAASTDDTGAAARGGDWQLEYQAGAIEAQVAPDAGTQARWGGLLALASVGSETSISSTAATEVTATDRQVAMDSTGKFVVVWQDGTNIKAQRYNADGSVNGGILAVTSSGTNSNAQVAMNDSGAFVIAWEDTGGNVYFQTYSSSGVAGTVTAVASAHTGSGGAPGYSYTMHYTYSDATVGINSAGEFIVAYTQNIVSTKDYGWSPAGPNNDTIQFKAYTAAGLQQGTNGSDDVSSATSGMNNAAIAMNASGTFVVTWSDGDTIQAQRYTAARASSGGILTINSNTSSFTRADPSAAIDDSGNFVISWTTNQGGNNDIYQRRYNSSGTALAAESLVHSSASNVQTVSSIAMNRNSGEYAIVYQDSSGSNDIYMRSFTAGGTAAATEAIVNTTTAGSQTTPSIAVNGAYGVVVWTTPGTATSDVHFQRLLAPNAAPVNTVPSTLQGVQEDTAKVFSSGNGNQISISDSDAGSNAVQVTLSATHGTLSLNGTSGLSFSVGDGNGDTTMTFTGTVTNINTALNGMSYTGSANYDGLDTLTIVTNDQGNTGSGGALSDTDTVTIAVVPVNDPTLNSVPGSQTINEDGSVTFSSGGGNLISVSDVDAGSTMQVTVSASHGVLTLGQLTGLTFTAGDGTSDASMTFKGSLANINAALANMNYVAVTDYNGTDTISITSQDATLATLNVDASLKARYTFESTGALGTDTSPSGTNTATLNNVTANNDATRGNVAYLNGNNAKLEVGNLMGSPTNVTLAAWVNLTTADTYGASVITIGDSVNLVLDETYIGDHLAAYFHDGSSWHTTSYNITLAGTGWHHVAYSVDSTNDVQTLYLDGVAVATTNYTQNTAYTNNTITRIGKFARAGWDGTGLNGNHDFNGLMDEARIYSRALSASEIAVLANDNPTPSATADTDNVTVNITAVNDAPVFGSASNFTSITEDQTTNSGQLVSTLFSSSDVDSGAATGIAIYSQTPSNGTWQYSTDGGSNWNSVGTVSSSSALLLRSTDKMRFVPDGSNADTGASVSFYAWDQTSGSTGTKVDVGTRGGTTAFSTSGGSSGITVTAVNDAPALSGANNLTAINEDNGSSTGTLVSALLSGKVSDVDTGASTGIAVTAVDNTNGAWQYTVDGGSSWNAFGSPSAAASRLLASNANTSVRFVPNANWNGTATITYRAWDQSTGTAGSTANTSSNGGTTAFSSATASPSITVNAVNDAPVFVSASNFTSITEDQTTNSGQLVSTLFSSSDVDSGAINGIAVYSQTPSNGTWQYSTDGGTSWNSVGTVSSASALLLRSTDKMRFVPDGSNADTGASVSFYAWDQTSGSTGTKVDVGTRGGTTAFSTSGGSSGITVTAVNDAPALSGANNLTAINEDNGSSTGTLVSALLSGKVSDVDTGASTGIAVTAVDNTNGAWQYTVDGGSSWNAFGSPSAAASRLLASNANTSVRFVPNANWNGTATITYRAWDQSTGTAGSTADTSGNGGTTAFSSATASPSITVNAVNDAPVFVSASNFTSITEDQTTNSGQLVSTLFSSSDVDSGAINGIAVYSQTPSNGTWQYSTDGGTSWNSVGTVSSASALLLRSTDKMRFVPDGSNADTGASIGFYIWDQTAGGAAGSKANAGTRGGTTAFSSSGGTSTITVTAINDAPVLSGTNNLTAINEDNGNSAGTLISALLSGKVSDVDTGASTGIAVTAVDNTNGTWQYTVDGGSSWNAFGSPSAAASRLLASNGSTLIRFVPNANWNGTATITYRAWDQSTGTAGSTADTSGNGGTTAFSTATASPSITVNAVNDAPTLTATAQNPTFTEAVGVASPASPAVNVFSGSTVGTVEAGQTIIGLSFTVGGLQDGASEKIVVDGTAITLGANSSGTTSANGMSYSVTIASGTATVTLSSGAGVSIANMQTLIDGITYQNTRADNPTAGARTFTLTQMRDSGGTSSGGVDTSNVSVASTVTVAALNDPPVASDDVASTNPGVPINVAVKANDSDPDNTTASLTVTIVSNSAGTTASVNGDGTIHFDPGFTVGLQTVVYHVTDGNGLSSGNATLTITVAPNSPPSGADGSSTVNEDAGHVFQVSDFGFTDPDPGQTFGGITLVSLPVNGSLTRSGVAVLANDVISAADIAAGYLMFTPVADENGTPYASFTFKVVDNIGGIAAVANTFTVNVNAVNDAPVLSGANDFTGINEDQTANSGELVSALIGSSDADSGAVQGLALYSTSAGNGSWQYSTDGGTSWNGVGVVDGSSALLLRASDRLRFVPDGHNADTASIGFYAWDQTSGAVGNKVDVGARGGTTAFSSAAGSASIAVSAVNDAPALTGTSNLTSISEDDTANAGQLVSSLFTSSDVDSGALSGIAVYGASTSSGAWQYSLDGGTTWTGMGNVGVGSALLLRATDHVRFVPAVQDADSASLSFLAWDQSSGSAGGTADVSLVGGTTAFSASGGAANLSITAVNDAPVLTGSSDFASINEDDAANNGQLVSSLFTSSDVDTGAASGIAIHDAAQGNGTWQYSLDGGTTWSGIGAVNGTSALLLRATDRVRFVPDGENADSGSLGFYAWDQRSGAAGNLVDVSSRGATTAFSSVGGTSSIAVTALNDAPVLTGSSNFASINEDDASNNGQLVSSLMSSTDVDAGASSGIAVHGLVGGHGSWQYSIDGGASWSGVGVVDATSALLLRGTDRLRFVPDGENADTASVSFHAWDQTSGQAGNKVDVSARGGSTAFSSASGTSGISVTAANDAPVLAGVSDFTAIDEDDTSNAGQLVSSLCTIVDVDSGAFGGIAIDSLTPSHGAWQYSLDGGTTWASVGAVSSSSALLLGASDRLRFVPDGQNADTASLTFHAWDQSSGSAGSKVDASTRGGGTAFSIASGSAAIAVADVNDAPVLTGSGNFSTIDEDSTGNAGQLVSSLFTSTDVDAGAARGVAIYGRSSGNGAWQYSLDGGGTWANIGAVSGNAALLLRDSDLLRFVPDGGNADSASLSFYAWDQSLGTEGGTADVTARAGSSAFSAAGGTSAITVTAVNDAPVLSGAFNFSGISEDETANAGQLVSSLFFGADVDVGAASGIALYGTANGSGAWQYSLDGGVSWGNVGVVDATGALLLRGNDLVRFVPDGRNADTASISFHAWDQTAGTAGSRVDVSTRGASTAFSTASGTSSITVADVNDAPVLTGTGDLASIDEDDGANAGQLVSSLFSSTDVDAGAATGIAVYDADNGRGTWQYSLDGGGNWADFGGVDTAHALLLRATDLVRFVPDGVDSDTASLSFHAWDQSSGSAGQLTDVGTRGASTPFSAASGSSSITVTPVNDAPVLTGTSNFTAILEDATSNNGQLVSSLFTSTDLDAGALAGIAIYDSGNGRGAWAYSLDGGATWSAMGSVDSSSALLLRATDRIRFVPDGLNADTASLSFHAWDQSTGVAGSKVDVGTCGAATPFSTASGSASINIGAVNDGPVLTGSSDFTSITEDDVGSAGQMVSSLFTVSDVDVGDGSGIAVFGASHGRGNWQYSLDGGTSWSDLGVVDTSSALLLRATDRLRFVPDGGNADSAALSFYAWDQTVGAAGDIIDVGSRGATTPFSTAAGSSAITVTAANDAPALTGSADFNAITEDETGNAGQLVSTLFTASDVDAGAVAGIAIHGSVNGRGNWQYSLDGGTTWSGMGTVDATSALLLRATDRLRFVPDALDADTASLSFHAWDQSVGTAGGRADVGTRAGTTPFSLASRTSAISVTAINDAPTLFATAGNPSFTEADGQGAQAPAVALFSGAVADAIEAGQKIASLSLTVSGLRDGAHELLTVDGSSFALDAARSGVTAIHGLGYALTLAGDAAALTLNASSGLTAAQTQDVVTGLRYQNTDTDNPTAGLRVVTLTRIQDDGGTAAGAQDSRAVSMASIVTVVAVDDAPPYVPIVMPGADSGNGVGSGNTSDKNSDKPTASDPAKDVGSGDSAASTGKPASSLPGKQVADGTAQDEGNAGEGSKPSSNAWSGRTQAAYLHGDVPGASEAGSAGANASGLVAYMGGNLPATGHNGSVLQLIELIKSNLVQASTDLNLAITPLNSTIQVLPMHASAQTWDRTEAPGETVSLKIVRGAAYSTGVSLTIGTVWWTARISGLVTSVLISTPAWRALDPLPVLTSNERENEEEEDDEHLGDREVERLFDADVTPGHDMPTIG